MDTSRRLILNFDTMTLDAESRLQNMVDKGYKVLHFDITNESAPAVSWECVAMTCLRVRKGTWGVAQKRLHTLAGKTPLVVIAYQHNEEVSQACLQLGVPDVICKDTPTVQSNYIFQNAIWLCHITEQKSAMSRHSQQLATLTPQQRRVLQLATAGHLNKQIASTLGLTDSGVEKIRSAAYRKLGVGTTAEMACAVVLGGLFQADPLNYA